MAFKMTPTVNRGLILRLLDEMTKEVGAEEMASMKLIYLEAAFRQRNPSVKMPGKTVLRECINGFRAARWPETAPKKLAR